MLDGLLEVGSDAISCLQFAGLLLITDLGYELRSLIMNATSGLVQDEEGTSEEWPASCSRRDANLFLRGVKRFGTIDRLPDIAAEIGAFFEAIPDAARSAITITLSVIQSI